MSYAGKNAYSAGKTTGVLRGGASGANRGYLLAHCAQLKGKAPRGHSNLLSPDRMDPGWMEPCGRWMMVTKIGERLILLLVPVLYGTMCNIEPHTNISPPINTTELTEELFTNFSLFK